MMWDDPQHRSLAERFGSFSRTIWLDRRGFGSSDSFTVEPTPSLDAWMEDIVAVLAAVGSERAAVVGLGEAGACAMLYRANEDITSDDSTASAVGLPSR